MLDAQLPASALASFEASMTGIGMLASIPACGGSLRRGRDDLVDWFSSHGPSSTQTSTSSKSPGELRAIRVITFCRQARFTWHCRSGIQKSILPCAISSFIAQGKGSSGRSISGPLPGLEGLPRGEPVGLLSRAARQAHAVRERTSFCRSWASSRRMSWAMGVQEGVGEIERGLDLGLVAVEVHCPAGFGGGVGQLLALVAGVFGELLCAEDTSWRLWPTWRVPVAYRNRIRDR